MIKFDCDHDIDKIDISNGEHRLRGLVSLLHYLAGQPGAKFSENTISEDVERLERVAPRAISATHFAYEQVNELLLLVDESRISRAFFNFFFSTTENDSPISLEDFKRGVRQFRGFAMLCYGNFRYAFRTLREINSLSALLSELEPWTRDSVHLEESFGDARPAPISHRDDTVVMQCDTYLLGYVVDAELQADRQRAKSSADSELEEKVKTLDRRIDKARKNGRINAAIYLTSDYLDVYFATSMRNHWEFLETYDFVHRVLSQPELKDLGIRHFDPTQAFMDGVLEKGLLEALMLKRAQCTVYLAQETDTLGKDSELAATLAQGKPVIAYVQALNGDKLQRHCEALRSFRVSYYVKRLHALFAEGFFSNAGRLSQVMEKLEQLGIQIGGHPVLEDIRRILASAEEVEGSRNFGLIGGEHEEEQLTQQFLDQAPEAPEYVAALDAVSLDKRARTIAEYHPLAMQVHLDKGVANGVLVVRDAESCARLLYGFLTSRLSFCIEPKTGSNDERLGTALREKISQSTFRYVTANRLVTNSFWNFYLRNEKSFTQHERQ